MKLPTPSPGFLLESSVLLKTVAKSASFRLFHAETGFESGLSAMLKPN